MGLYGSTDVFR